MMSMLDSLGSVLPNRRLSNEFNVLIYDIQINANNQLPVAIFPVHMPSMQLTLLFPAPLQGMRADLYIFLLILFCNI
ncbi:hypothetical protein ACFX15_030930 [Malus domestica]